MRSRTRGRGGRRGASAREGLRRLARHHARVRVPGAHRRALGRGAKRPVGAGRPGRGGMDDSGRAHRVPLSPRALEVLDGAAELFDGQGFVFPSPTGRVLNHATMTSLLRGLGIDAVAHGFRSSFRDWAAECTDAHRDQAPVGRGLVGVDPHVVARTRGAMASSATRTMNVSRPNIAHPAHRRAACPRPLTSGGGSAASPRARRRRSPPRAASRRGSPRTRCRPTRPGSGASRCASPAPSPTARTRRWACP